MKFMHKSFEESAAKFPAFHGQRGSIVRLKIIDFMTYHEVEMFAGPNVNLILGPNGTGKSTIVCAICLALAGKPSILGRANNLKEYIRHDCKTAIVEVELYNPPSAKDKEERGNWTIKRVIREADSGAISTSWYLNGTSVNQSQIETLTRSLSIQLDNLCQFLAQDRVQDFAKQDAVQLLKSTENAIGRIEDVELWTLHHKLIELQREIFVLKHKIKRCEETLRIEVQHKMRAEQDLETHKEREKIKRRIRDLEGTKLWWMYHNAQREFLHVRTELLSLQADKKNEEQKLVPLKRSVETLSVQLSKWQNNMNQGCSASSNFLGSVKRDYRDKVEKAEQDIIQYKAELDTAENHEKERIRHLSSNIERVKCLQNELDTFNNERRQTDEEWREELRRLEAEQKDTNFRIFDIESMDSQDETDIKNVKKRIAEEEFSLKEFDTQRSQRLRYISQRYPDLYKAVAFYAKPENKAHFRGEMHEPMILHIGVKDLRYGKIAERHIPSEDLYAFFFTHKDDVKTMISINHDNNMKVSAIHHEMPPNFTTPKGLWTPELRAKYGFSICLVDVLDIPNPYYMSYVVRSRHPELILIGTAKTDEISETILENEPYKTFYTDKFMYLVRTSYYTGKKNMTQSHLYDAQIFNKNSNTGEKGHIEARVAQYQQEIEDYRNKINERAHDLQSLKEERDGIGRRITEIQLNIQRRYELTKKIDIVREHTRTYQSGSGIVEKQRESTTENTYAARLKQLKHCEGYIDKVTELAPNWLEILYRKKQIAHLTKVIAEKRQNYDEAKRKADTFADRFKELDHKVKLANQCAKKTFEAAKEKTGLEDVPESVKKGDPSEKDVDAEMNEKQARLNFLPQSSDRVIQEHEERLKKIKVLEQSKDQMVHEMDEKVCELEVTRNNWLDPLQRLVHNININFGEFFAKMQCVGEVELDKGEDENDFSKYGIKVKVKFRATETLTELTGTRQSGGERAITTALYILALQELTKVPFRVIDEINQGMDAANELRFFNLLCRLAIGESTPQYFLLTPKLLPPVDYPDNVDFHVIFNGPYINVRDELVKKEKSSSSRNRRRKLSRSQEEMDLN